jgi:hypothetical protein
VLTKRFLIFLSVGLVAVGIVVWFSLYATRGSHMELKGSIQKVRIHPADEKSSVVIVDFRFVNPASYPYIVRSVDVKIEDAKGQMHEGSTISDVDAGRLLEYYRLLGPKYNQSLIIRERIAPGQSLDRMIAARFEVPEAVVQSRKRLTVRIEEVDGQVTELTQ